MGAPYLLGIDLGTTTCRAAVFDQRGRQIGASSLETAARHPRPTWAEVDPRVWWEGTVRVLRMVAAHDVGARTAWPKFRGG